MGRTFRNDKRWGGSGLKKVRSKKVVEAKKDTKDKNPKDDFWDDPSIWDNEDFEKFNDKRGRKRGF
jgi:hypothetical protein